MKIYGVYFPSQIINMYDIIFDVHSDLFFDKSLAEQLAERLNKDILRQPEFKGCQATVIDFNIKDLP